MEVQEINREPGRGVVHHIGQFHLATGVNDYESHVIIGRHRAAVLRKLGCLPVSACFLEGEDQAYGAKYRREPDEYERFLLRTLFPKRVIPNRLTDEQAIHLARGWMSEMLQYFYPALSLYGAEPNEERNAMEMRQGADEKLRMFHLFELRDRVAMECMSKYLGELHADRRQVAIIYGAGHSFFADESPGAEHVYPSVVKYTFESILPNRKSRCFQAAASEDEQMRLLLSPGRISLQAWPAAKSIEVQLKLLPRLKASVDQSYNVEVLRDRLLAEMKDGGSRELLVAEIMQEYAKKEGPFSDLKRRSGWDYFREQVKGGDHSYIENELHPYTQLELLRLVDSITVNVWLKLRTQTAQIEGLTKLSISLSASPKRTLDLMLTHASTEAVEERLLALFYTHSGPFYKSVVYFAIGLWV